MENWERILLIIFILIFIIIFDLFLYFKTDKLISNTENDLSKLKQTITENNISQSESNAKDLSKNWEKTEKIFSFFIEHAEIEKVSVKVAIIEENTKNRDYESALEDIAEVKSLLKTIEERYNFTLRNVI